MTDPNFASEKNIRPGDRRTIAAFSTAALGEPVDWYGASLDITTPPGWVKGNITNIYAYHSGTGQIFPHPIDPLAPAPQAVRTSLGVRQNTAKPETVTVIADVASNISGEIKVCLRGMYARGVTSTNQLPMADICGPSLSILP